jgi:hypothetical protein
MRDGKAKAAEDNLSFRVARNRTVYTAGCLMVLAIVTNGTVALGSVTTMGDQRVKKVSPHAFSPAVVDRHLPSRSLALDSSLDIFEFDDQPAYHVSSRQTGAILHGAGLLKVFSQKGAYWIAHVQVRQSAAYPGECSSTHLACVLHEELFFDSVAKKRVTSLSAVGPGSWFLDYNSGTVYMGDNPTGYTVELSLSDYAFILQSSDSMLTWR